MIRVCVSGARGRMGRMLVALVQQAEDLRLTAALERPQHPDLGLSFGAGVELSADPVQAIAQAEVLLDFSLPEAVCTHAELAAKAKRAVVTGTTGFAAEQIATLRRAAERVAMVQASNFSPGVYALTELVRKAAQMLAAGYDVEIFEAHHRDKVDSPSGTAWQLAEAVREQRGGRTVYGRQARRSTEEIGLSAVRGGDVVGEHQVMFLGRGEQVVLTHRATTREHFCRGALAAVRFAAHRAPGFYTASDVFADGGR